MTPDVAPSPKKKRKKSDVIAFEKNFGEPLTEQELDELADLIASMIFDSLQKSASNNPTPST
jgi:hypothetical protein